MDELELAEVLLAVDVDPVVFALAFKLVVVDALVVGELLGLDDRWRTAEELASRDDGPRGVVLLLRFFEVARLESAFCGKWK